MFKTVMGGKALSPAAVAFQIEKTAEHLLAEHNLAELRKQQTEIGAEMRELIAESQADQTTNRHWARINALDLKAKEISGQIIAMKNVLTPLRAARGARVEAALADRRTAAARDIANALEEALAKIQAPLATLMQINSEVAAAGGEVGFAPNFGDLEPMLRNFRRLAGE